MTSFVSVYPGSILEVTLLSALSAVPFGHFQLGNTVLKNRKAEIEGDLYHFCQRI